MHTYSINPRLCWIADRVRQNVLFYDVGTDHGKLPIYLVKTGKIQKAIASDIGEAPAARAQMNIRAHRLADAIEVCVTDGLCGLSVTPPADIAICGMGGETMIGIIEAAPFLRKENIRLLLQPMTDFALVRSYLYANGFAVFDEDVILSEGRMYQCLAAEYTGERRTVCGVEAELGEITIRKKSPAFFAYVEHRRKITQKCKNGKSKIGADTSEEDMLLAAYDRILEEKA